MIEKAMTGGKQYKLWMLFLMVIMGIGGYYANYQMSEGLHVTGMSRDITWGVYIAQFTFMVGVAAGGVMLVLPYYLHNYKAFGRIVILGEFMAIAAIAMCLLFVVVDMGKPMRLINIMLYPTPHSMLFWDVMVINGYLLLNIVGGWVALTAEKKGIAPPKWLRPIILLSIPWAFSIHTVTAFLYAGLPGRHLWLTAILAPRFLASAFAAGPALLIIVALILKKFANFDAGKEAIQKLATIITYAMIANFFFVGLEFFTAYYSNIPGHMHSLEYLFFGLDGHNELVPYMWFSVFLGLTAILLLLLPGLKQKEGLLALIAGMVFISLWIDKGVGMVIGGFIPNPLEQVRVYSPTLPEVMITIGIWAVGAFILSALYKIAISVKLEKEA